MVQEVVADLDTETAEIVLAIHWAGGIHTELRLPRRRRGQRNSTGADIIAAVRDLVRIANDDVIASLLNRNGLRTGNGNRWTRERVTSMRSHHRIPVCRVMPDEEKPCLNLGEAAKLLGIAPKTLRLAAEAGKIAATHPLPDGPWIFDRHILDSDKAKLIARQAKTRRSQIAGQTHAQENLFETVI
ncbi:MerR family transcriptional regulator [Gluconacetobacter aggeris]|uniref:hypothetical protein n=1 Tax=Gluconacetobacter aggeris TaxID=1286186 RepID=UPI001FEC35BF|nr:hypothetical protein [Gluconacetobacter aggeris]